MPTSERQEQMRLHMVNGQLRTCDVNDTALLEAFLHVRREDFTAPTVANLAYVDSNVAASGPPGRTLLAPRSLGLLLQAAAIKPGERVLDVGGGSGYGAALIARLGAKVIALETDVSAAREALAGLESVECVEGALGAGVPSRAPFDVIVINGGFEVTPEALLQQLGVGGRLVGMDSRSGANRGILIDRSATGFGSRVLFDGRADSLDGLKRPPGFDF